MKTLLLLYDVIKEKASEVKTFALYLQDNVHFFSLRQVSLGGLDILR